MATLMMRMATLLNSPAAKIDALVKLLAEFFMVISPGRFDRESAMENVS